MHNADYIGLSLFGFDPARFSGIVIDFLDISSGDRENVIIKPQINYLCHYIGKLGAKSFVVEHNYIDRNIHRDHSAHWTVDTSISQYFPARLHFFKENLCDLCGIEESTKTQDATDISSDYSYLDNTDLLSLLDGIDKIDKKQYLGNVVIMRGSTEFICSTVLQKPKYGAARLRHIRIPTTRRYTANLLGKSLELESLGFMEQNRAVSECATCAVWNILQKTSDELSHRALSPGRITVAAMGQIRARSRGLNRGSGLFIEEIFKVFEELPQLNTKLSRYDNSTRDRLSDLYGLINKALPILKLGMPIILGIKIKNATRQKELKHAICLTGYTCYPNEKKHDLFVHCDNYKPNFEANQVCGLIAHDDNMGPFVEYQINKDGKLQIANINGFKRLPPQKDSHIPPTPYDREYAVIAAIFVLPYSIKTYDKSYIYGTINTFIDDKEVLEKYFWDFQVCKSSHYKNILVQKAKAEYAKSTNISVKEGWLSWVIALASKNIPKYIYIAHAKRNDGQSGGFDIVYSLSDPRGEKILGVLPFDDDSYNLIRRINEQQDVNPAGNPAGNPGGNPAENPGGSVNGS